MYKKKLGVRVITAITVGALLSSNMSVAMANTQIATLEDNLDEKTADKEKNVEEEETETVDETVEETETEEAEEEESTDEIEESDSEEEVTGDEEDTVETEEEETPVEEKTEEETDKEEEAPAETDDPSGASDDAEELPAEETEEETDTAEEGVPEENTDAKEEVPAEEETVEEETEKAEENETVETVTDETAEMVKPVTKALKKPAPKVNEDINVKIKFVGEDGSEVDTASVTIPASFLDNNISADMLYRYAGQPLGDEYELVNRGETYYLNNTEIEVTIKVKKVADIKEVTVYYYDPEVQNTVGEDTYELPVVNGYVSIEDIPELKGYEIDLEQTGTDGKVQVTGDAIQVVVKEIKQEPEVDEVSATLYFYENGELVDSVNVSLNGISIGTTITADMLYRAAQASGYELPEYYELVDAGAGFVIKEVSVEIPIEVKNVAQDITVYYYDEEAGESAGDAVAKLVVRNDKVSRADIPVPEGYVIDEEATPEEITVTDGAIQVVVKAVTHYYQCCIHRRPGK